MIYPLIYDISYHHPSTLFSRVASITGSFLLESSLIRQECGRYSFIGVDPFRIMQCKKGKIYCDGKKILGNPFDFLEEQLALFPLSCHAEFPPFQGGISGFFSYELYRYLENITATQVDDMHFPDMCVGFYDLVIGFDHELERSWIFSSGYPLHENKERESRARKRIEWLLKKMESVPSCDSSQKAMLKNIHSNFTAASYQAAVEKVKRYILEGDIYQANISQRFSADWQQELSPFDLYQQLRLINPASFAAYINLNDTVIVSASPERFIKLTAGQVETRPIKGTKPRGKNPEEDLLFATELMKSEKNQAENVMIVDLLRNDLSRVCENHSVHVPTLCNLESFKTVHHLVSTITGKLLPAHHAIDLLRATFPGGSITGAPKIRAMEIIAEIEPTERGPYCGSIGYIGFNGDMDTSIAIRTFAIKNNRITFQAGGAVVLDSEACEEYEETIVKVKALNDALTHY